jgi:hypothetical protein
MMLRRTVLAAGPALLAGPALAQGADLKVRGSKAYSESSMVMGVTPDGASAVTLRFCRFPEEGQTWLWCHVLHEGRFYAYTAHDLPCSKDRLAAQPNATWQAPPLSAQLVRVRRGDRLLPAVRISAELPFHESRSAPHGPGDVPIRISAQFLGVSALGAQVLEGREEVYGLLNADLLIDGRKVAFEGLAKFHEQRQEAPRFQAPFCYAFLSGEAANATTLLLARGATGGWQLDGREEPLADMVLDPPGDTRQAIWKFRSGRALEGRLRALVRYRIPVYDRLWNGSFVKGEAGGRPVVGVMNDWTTEADIYLASAKRSQKP